MATLLPASAGPSGIHDGPESNHTLTPPATSGESNKTDGEESVLSDLSDLDMEDVDAPFFPIAEPSALKSVEENGAPLPDIEPAFYWGEGGNGGIPEFHPASIPHSRPQ
jgi:hypothetical protein